MINKSLYWFKQFSSLLEELPDPDDTWTSNKREKFLKAFTALVDLCVKVDDNPIPDTEQQQEKEWFGEGIS